MGRAYFMKKIAINMLPFRDRLTGTGYYIKRLLHHLQQMDKDNEYYLFFGNIKDPSVLFNINAENFKIITYPSLNSKVKRIFFEQAIFPFILKKLRPNTLFCPSVAVPLFSFSGAKIITTIHDLIPFVFKNKYSFIQRNYFNLISYLSAKKADIILTVSENSKKDIIKFLNIKEEKIKVLYNFLPPDMPQKKEIEREKFFITVSTVQPGKNLERLFEAYSIFSKIHPEYELLVIGGKGWKSEPIYKKVETLKINEKIKFVGYVDDAQLAVYYQKAKALVYVSLYEGFGIPPLEAMNYNCPVVVSNVSSLPEVVGEAGIMVHPYNILSILDGMKSVLNENFVNEKKMHFSVQLEKFKGITETRKLIQFFES
jgi:glycosyltransferase involved in cell wall biosynthesis